MKNIVLIEPNQGLWETGKFTRHSSFEPLSIEYIGAFIQEKGYEVNIVQQRSTSSENLIKEILLYSPEVVGFSSMTYNMDFTRELCGQIKAQNKNIVTIIGGYHPSCAPEVVQDENIDFAIIGEGEITFYELLQALENGGQTYKGVKGIAYWDNGLIVNKRRPRITDLDNLPFPMRSDALLKDCKINALTYPRPSEQINVAQVVYSRGCPYSCTYCVSPVLWGKQAIYRSPDNVIQELLHLKKCYNTNLIFFPDLTFNLDKKKVISLCENIIKSKINMNWFCMCHVDLFEKTLANIMKEAGCTKIAFGIETFNKTVKEEIKPQSSQKIEEMAQKLQMCSDLGILIRGYFMLGHPHEQKDMADNTIRLLKSLPIDEIKMSFLTPFPGTPLFAEMRNQTITNDYSRYTTDEPVVANENFTTQSLIEARERIVKEFYNSKEYEQRMQSKIKRFPYLKKSYDEFLQFLAVKKILQK
jgi:anaerobic magnesium-protoporphyrin IX monomethyl ester cyclase